MKIRKIISGLTAAVILAAVCGCSGGENNGKLTLSVGDWPSDVDQTKLQTFTGYEQEFEEQNPDIDIKPDTYSYDTKTFTMKATAGQLPNLYNSWFAETAQIIKNGYAADITDQMKKYGYDKAMNPELLEFVSDDNGRIYGFPTSAYAMGLYINKDVFTAAGLVNADGSVMIPDTYEEMMEYAKIIKEKTGKGGFMMATTDNCGGWQFMNIAWSYGVNFTEQDSDGKWKATFNTSQAKEALQYIYDMKWTANAMPDQTVVSMNDLLQLFATGNIGMMIANPPCQSLASNYDINKDSVVVAKIPAGPEGRFSQMGGDLVMFSNTCTPEQIEAGFKWLSYRGYSPEWNEETEAKQRTVYEDAEKLGQFILPQNAFDLWKDENYCNGYKKLAKEYTNVKEENWDSYFKGFEEDVTIRPEEPVSCQELYSILDRCIQEVITNRDADINGLIEEANNDFQTNHLDKAE